MCGGLDVWEGLIIWRTGMYVYGGLDYTYMGGKYGRGIYVIEGLYGRTGIHVHARTGLYGRTGIYIYTGGLSDTGG